MTITADLSGYPLAEETRTYLDDVAFGHVIDGELVPSASGATMPIIEPSTGAEIGTVAAGDAEDLERAVGAARRAFEDGRWRNLAPLEKERRLRRLSELFAANGAVFGDLDTLDAGLLRGYTDAIVQFAVAGLDYYAGWPSKITGTIPATGPDVVGQRHPRAARRGRHHRALERAGVRHQLRRGRAGVRQLGRAQAGRADADVGDADGSAGPGRGHPARRLQRHPRHRRGDRSRPRRPSPRRRHRVHRVGGDRPADPGRRAPLG